jgi:HSP20 family protein
MHVVAVPSEIGEFTEEVRRIFRELGRGYAADTLAGECAPPLDVFETDDAIEIVVDLPGTEAAGVRLMARGDAVLIAGEKPARRVRAESSFHLVERGYGRFARVVRLGRACDTSRAKARLVAGELRVTLPKVADRRGQAVPIAIAGAANG